MADSTELKEKEQESGSRNVLTLGWVAFFGGLSQDMMQPVLPTFYSQVLGLSKGTIGLIEGSMTTVVSIFKILSGILSDKLGKRKSIVFIGYLLSAIGRFLIFLATGSFSVLGLRLLDGVGKGLKDAPRDALVAKSSDKKKMGFAFGLQRTLDTLGSFIGPLITSYLLLRFAAYGDIKKYRYVFIVAGTIAFTTILLLGLFVKERVGNNVGISAVTIPLIIAVFNLFYALLSIPSGMLSDKIGRVNVIRLGWALYAITYIGFGLARLPWHIWALYIVYGVYYSTTEGIAKSLVVHLVDESRRGTAFGLYNASVGLLAIPASAIAGLLWDKVSSSAPFYFGAACSILAIILITIFKIEKA